MEKVVEKPILVQILPSEVEALNRLARFIVGWDTEVDEVLNFLQRMPTEKNMIVNQMSTAEEQIVAVKTKITEVLTRPEMTGSLSQYQTGLVAMCSAIRDIIGMLLPSEK